MKLSDVDTGHVLGPLVKPPITTKQLVMYAGASGDFNPIHYDSAFAQAGGFPSVIAHGMLSMGFFGELVSRWAGARNVKKLSTRFKAVTFPGDVVTVEGRVESIDLHGASGATALIQLTAKTQKGVVTLEGTAVVQLD
jgi:acyl dehydratase